ncbi:kelch-like protein 7 [Eurytemora carolleeae]|uniref:kelch-like protein 7 n=1 Tax=Eurytemora carolleeae TaxID=1294199 RepID=UPI000C78D121|nr:kelch-like protein 7 [Eurytemora carolleeae]|eukprot:XP_023347849.1 kelch-like protein 7 [Eurytemora affinis]
MMFHCTVRYLDRFFMVIDGQTTRVYDTVKGSNEFLPPLLKPVRSFGCGTFLDAITGEELILVTGGRGGSGNIADCQVFTPSLGVWTTISPLNAPRAEHSVVTTVDGVFAVGGGGLVEQLNPTTLTWQSVSPDFWAGKEVAAAAVPDDAV